MIGYTLVGSNDRKKSGAFFDALFGEIGGKRVMEDGDRSSSGPMVRARWSAW